MQAPIWNGVYGSELDSDVFRALPGHINKGESKPDGSRYWRIFRELPTDVDTKPFGALRVRGIHQLNSLLPADENVFHASDVDLDARLTVGFELIDSGDYEPFEGAAYRRFETVLKFEKPKPGQDPPSMMEAHREFLIPGLDEDSILKGVKFRMSAYIESTGQLPDGKSPAWGPSTVIRALALTLQKKAFERVLKQQNLTEGAGDDFADIKDDLAEATSHFALSLSDLFVKGCVCGDRVDCVFHRGQVEAYARALPTSDLENPNPVPSYEFHQFDQKVDDDWLLRETLPAYPPGLRELKRDFDRFCQVVGNATEREAAVNMLEVLSEARNEPDYPEDASARTRRVYGVLSNIQASLQRLWADLPAGNSQVSSWSREKNALKGFAHTLSRMLDMDTVEIGLSQTRLLYTMIKFRMTPLILEGTDLNKLWPANFDKIVEARQEFWALHKAATKMIGSLRDSRGKHVTGVRRIIKLPGREDPLIFMQSGFEGRGLTGDNMRAVWAVSEARRVKLIRELSDDETGMILLEPITEIGEALRQLIKNYNKEVADRYVKSAAFQTLGWAISAYGACIEMLHRTIDATAAQNSARINTRSIINSGMLYLGETQSLDIQMADVDIPAPSAAFPRGAMLWAQETNDPDFLFDMLSTTGITPALPSSKKIKAHEQALARMIGSNFEFLRHLCQRALPDNCKKQVFYQPMLDMWSSKQTCWGLWDMLTYYDTVRRENVVAIKRFLRGGFEFSIRGQLAAAIKSKGFEQTLREGIAPSKVILCDEP